MSSPTTLICCLPLKKYLAIHDNIPVSYAIPPCLCNPSDIMVHTQMSNSSCLLPMPYMLLYRQFRGALKHSGFPEDVHQSHRHPWGGRPSGFASTKEHSSLFNSFPESSKATQTQSLNLLTALENVFPKYFTSQDAAKWRRQFFL